MCLLEIHCLLMLLTIIQSAYITFDTGSEERYEFIGHNEFWCLNGNTFSYTTSFNGEFQRNPKIIFSNFFYNIDFTPPSEHTFNITSITKTSFTTLVNCPRQQQFWGMKFQWIAVDDDRIEVINVFNQDMTNQGSKQYTYSHSNFNALQGFVTKLNVGINGMLDFNLTIDSITTDKVVVNFISSNANLLSIGYQVVLGNSGAFTQESAFKIYTDFNNDKSYDTGFLLVPNGVTLILPYCGIYYTNTGNIRQRRITLVSNSDGVQYRYESWYYSLVDLVLRKVWFKQTNSQTFIPYLCQKFRVSKLSDPNAPLYSLMTFKVPQLNIQESISYSQVLILDNTHGTLDLIVNFKCSIGKIMTGKLLKCINCLEQDKFWIINQVCYQGMNSATFYITLNQPDQVYSKIQIDVTSYGFTITQSVTNYDTTSYQVIILRIDPH